MSEWLIYHNPRCTKSRQSLELLRARGIEPRIVLYMEQLLSEKALRDLLRKLDMRPRDLLRRNETAYREQSLDDPNIDDRRIVECMASNPKLIERPIVVRGARAVIGRPPDNILALLT